MASNETSPRWQTLTAFAIIYLVWGSTFLAIRVGVREVPPFLFAAMRFVAAGLALCGWTLARHERMPSRRQWGSAFVLAFLIFVLDYGVLYWAEQRVPSGLTAVMMATIPAFMSLSEVVFLGTQKFTARLAGTLSVGLAGVTVLVSHSLHLGGAPIDGKGAAALLVASLSWSIASAFSRKLPLPSSKTVSSGAQMLAGGLLLSVAATARGELASFHPVAVSRAAWFALLYLIVAGSIVAFTAYVWLLQRESPTKVGAYAYVNPVVAVLLGYLFAGEPLGVRTLLGSLLVLVSVVLLTTIPARQRVSAATVEA